MCTRLPAKLAVELAQKEDNRFLSNPYLLIDDSNLQVLFDAVEK
jgi:hypothetical protein